MGREAGAGFERRRMMSSDRGRCNGVCPTCGRVEHIMRNGVCTRCWRRERYALDPDYRLRMLEATRRYKRRRRRQEEK